MTIGDLVPKEVQNVGIRLQFLPLSGRIRDPFKLVESMQKGVASLPILNITANRSCGGIASATSVVADNRMISTMDGKEKPDTRERSGE